MLLYVLEQESMSHGILLRRHVLWSFELFCVVFFVLCYGCTISPHENHSTVMNALQQSSTFIFPLIYSLPLLNWKGVHIELDSTNNDKLTRTHHDDVTNIHAADYSDSQTVHFALSKDRTLGEYENHGPILLQPLAARHDNISNHSDEVYSNIKNSQSKCEMQQYGF